MDIPELPFPFSLFLKYFWLLSIGATCFNAYILNVRSQKYIQEDPSRKVGYDKLLKGYIIYLNIPWVAMGIGSIFGKIPTMFDFIFNVQSLNPFILLFWGTVILLWILLAIWVYFRGGAEFLTEYPGVLNYNIRSPILIKILVALMLASGVFAIISILNIGG